MWVKIKVHLVPGTLSKKAQSDKVKLTWKDDAGALQIFQGTNTSLSDHEMANKLKFKPNDHFNGILQA